MFYILVLKYLIRSSMLYPVCEHVGGRADTVALLVPAPLYSSATHPYSLHDVGYGKHLVVILGQLIDLHFSSKLLPKMFVLNVNFPLQIVSDFLKIILS